MNEASQWRFELAKQIAPCYAQIVNVSVIEVGGSVSHDCADQYSDIEIGIFWSTLPTEEIRHSVALQAGATEWHAYEYEHDEWSEEFLIGGVKVDVSHRTLMSMERCLSDVIDRYETDITKQNLIAAIQHAIPLHGDDLLKAWQKKASTYPERLAEAMVVENLMLGPQSWLDMLAKRDSLIELYGILTIISKRLLGTLLGLNHVYHPGFKWLDRLIDDLPIAPVELKRRLKGMFLEIPANGVTIAQELAEETYTLVERFMPRVDTSSARTRLLKPRPMWDKKPI